MSIQSEITRIAGNVTSALEEIANKGVEVPTDANSDDLAPLIRGISAGAGKSIEDAVVTLETAAFLYDGTEKEQKVESVVLDGVTLVEGTDYIITNNTAVNAGTHTLSILGIMEYGGVATAEWTIERIAIDKPTITGSYTYTGNTQTVALDGFDAGKMSKSGDESASDAGTYTLTVSLSDPLNTEWNDDTSDAIQLQWTIEKMNIAIPSLSGTYTYNGEVQSVTVQNIDTNRTAKSGDISATDAGNYTLVIVLNDPDNTQWSDGTNDALSLDWSIAKMSLVKPTVSGTYTFNNNTQAVSLKDYNSTYHTLGGDTEGKAAGSYIVTVALADPDNTQWSDNTTTTLSLSWSIGKLSLTKPTTTSAFTYDGNTKTPTISNYNATYQTQSGDTSASGAGDYTVTISLKDKTSTQWTGGGTADIALSWSIAKATGSITVSPTSLTISGAAGATKTATITKTGDGAVSVASNKTGVATATISDATVTVKSVADGSATITITLAEGDNYTGDTCTISVSVSTISTTLENNDWSVIKSVGAAGTGANYWSVGDRKSVAVSGTVGAASLSGTYYAYILGFNHNSSVEGNGIHFMMGKTAASGGVDIAFCDSSYNSTGSTAAFRMNTTNTNSGGWSGSYMNKTICPAFLSALPSALQSAISACTKYSDNTGGGSNTASYVTSSSSKIWLPAEFEVQGTRSYANSAEQNYQKQYAYYANGNSKIKYKSNGTSTACRWWLRSVYSDTGNGFCSVYTDGSAGASGAYYSFGFAPCFKVA